MSADHAWARDAWRLQLRTIVRMLAAKRGREARELSQWLADTALPEPETQDEAPPRADLPPA